MHIAILCDNLPPDALGGAGKVAWQLGQGLIAAGHRVTFVTSTQGPTGKEDRHGIPVYAFRSKYPQRWMAWIGLFNPLTVVPLNRLLRELKPDIVHAHTVNVHLSYHSLVIGRYAGAATVFTAHDVMPFSYTKLTHYIDPSNPNQTGPWDYRLPLGYNLRRMRLRWNPARNLSIRHTMSNYVDARVAVSHALKEALESNKLPPFEVVHNAIDPASFDVPEAGIDVLRQRLKLEGRRVILFGGRLAREKGDVQLLTALRQVKQQVPNVTVLVLARSSSYSEQLLGRFPDLADHLVFGGWLDGAELATAYHLADIVASPSICFDSFLVMNLEGMATGAVPVTTCFGGASEAVLDGETGFVVNPHNTDLLAERITRLLRDEALRQQMAQAGRRRLEQHFTLAQQTDAMLDVYERARASRHQDR